MSLVKIGAAWIKDGKKGKFMAGNITINEQEISVMIFKNDKGDNPKRPDYTINQVMDDEQMDNPREKELPDEQIPF